MVTEQEIKNAASKSIIEVVTTLTGKSSHRKGDNVFFQCPFHNDKTPSFSVSEKEGLYYCFGCGAKGNVIQFVEHYTGKNFGDSVRYLNGDLEGGAEIANFRVVEIEKKKTEKQVANANLLQDFISEIMGYNTQEDYERVETYLNSRRLSLTDFGWEKENNIFTVLEEPILIPLPKQKSYEAFAHTKKELLKTYTLAEMQEHGLFGEKGSVYGFFDFCFVYYGEGILGEAPMTNLQARKIISEKGEIREMFIKNKIVLPYNMHLLSRLPNNANIYLTEAPIDAVSLHKLLTNPKYPFSVGQIPFVVSTGGSTIKANRLIEIAKKKDMQVVLAMDNDNAGDIATNYWLEKFKDNGIKASKFNGIPRGRKDPNEYLQCVWKSLFS